MKLNIIYRVCDSVHVCSAPYRCFNITKTHLIKKCLLSLKKNIENLDDNIELKIYCVHDNCSDDLMTFIHSLYDNIEFIELKQHGNANSFCTCVDIAKNQDDDSICFFLEDDYVFLKNDILNKICVNMRILSMYNNKYVAMMPDDYPDRYKNNRIDTECRITQTGHFLRIYHTTCTFIMYAKDVKEQYDNLMVFSKWPNVGENESINKCWQTVPLYQPIPAYTVHSQLLPLVPIYIDRHSFIDYFQSPL